MQTSFNQIGSDLSLDKPSPTETSNATSSVETVRTSGDKKINEAEMFLRGTANFGSFNN